MKKVILLVVSVLAICSCCSTGNSTANEVPRVIFDTDLGNDIDDVLAMQMLINYHQAGKIELIGVSICKNNRHSIEFVDGYCRFNGLNDMPLGFAYDGVTPDDYFYLVPTLEAKYKGRPLLKPVKDIKVMEGYKFLRKMLAAQPDASVTLIAVGPLTNIGNLLVSEADEFSTLSGRDLVAAKVSRVVTMAGAFDSDISFGEYNVVCDLEAAKRTFELCPVPLTTSGFEVGRTLCYPHESILNDFGDPLAHPLCVAYTHYQPMPYDRETWDLTAVLDAVEQGAFFETSAKGTIVLDEQGRTSLVESKDGKQDYLIIPEAGAEAALKALVNRTTGKKNTVSRDN